MIFAGDKDFICNYVGLEAMIQNLEWAGAKGLGEVETMNWSVGGRRAGTWVESRGLTYAKVRCVVVSLFRPGFPSFCFFLFRSY